MCYPLEPRMRKQFLARAKKVDKSKGISGLSCLPSLLRRCHAPFPADLHDLLKCNTVRRSMCTFGIFKRILIAAFKREKDRRKLRKMMKVKRKFYFPVQIFQPRKRVLSCRFLPHFLYVEKNLILKYKQAGGTPQQYRFKPFN